MGKHVGSYIRVLREKKGLSQSDVASMLGLRTAQSISNIERGVSPLPRAKIKRFAGILGVSKGEIVNVLMSEMQERVAKAAGVKSRAIICGPEMSTEDYELVSGLVDRLSSAPASQRALIKKTVGKLVEKN